MKKKKVNYCRNGHPMPEGSKRGNRCPACRKEYRSTPVSQADKPKEEREEIVKKMKELGPKEISKRVSEFLSRRSGKPGG